jgi:hypothetical protein
MRLIFNPQTREKYGARLRLCVIVVWVWVWG